MQYRYAKNRKLGSCVKGKTNKQSLTKTPSRKKLGYVLQPIIDTEFDSFSFESDRQEPLLSTI